MNGPCIFCGDSVTSPKDTVCAPCMVLILSSRLASSELSMAINALLIAANMIGKRGQEVRDFIEEVTTHGRRIGAVGEWRRSV